MGSNLPKIAAGIAAGAIKTLIVFGEDVTKLVWARICWPSSTPSS
jgi:hypothetical protein